MCVYKVSLFSTLTQRFCGGMVAKLCLQFLQCNAVHVRHCMVSRGPHCLFQHSWQAVSRKLASALQCRACETAAWSAGVISACPNTAVPRKLAPGQHCQLCTGRGSYAQQQYPDTPHPHRGLVRPGGHCPQQPASGLSGWGQDVSGTPAVGIFSKAACTTFK